MKARSGAWNDTVWLSSTADLNAAGNERWALGSVRRNGGLAQGQSYTATQTFQLAPSMKGAYIIVRTDQFGAETESEHERPR